MGPDIILRGNNPQDRMSALPPKADMDHRGRDVRFVPKADIVRCGERRRYSMTSSAIASTPGGIVRASALAVLRLIASSSLVGCRTGRSATFVPLRTRAV